VDIYSKKNILFINFIILFLSISLYGQKKNYISIVVPEKLNTTTTSSNYRLAANTLPKSSVEINGKKLKVYPSGAFVDLMKLEIGENEFIIKSKNKGKTVTEKFFISREDDEIVTTEDDEIVIEEEIL